VKKSLFGWISLGLGILSIVPFLGILYNVSGLYFFLLSPVAVISGIIGLFRERKRWRSILGILIGSVPMLLFTLLMVLGHIFYMPV